MDWEAFAKVVTAFGLYAWPTVALILCLLFKEELRDLGSRVTEAFGVKFAPAAKELAAIPTSVLPAAAAPTAAGKQSNALPPAPPPVNVKVSAAITDDFSAAAATAGGRWDQIADDARLGNPELAVIALAIEFEQELRRFAELSEVVPQGARRGAGSLLKACASRLDEGVVETADALIRTRNQLVHGQRIERRDVPKVREIAELLILHFRRLNGEIILSKAGGPG